VVTPGWRRTAVTEQAVNELCRQAIWNVGMSILLPVPHTPPSSGPVEAVDASELHLGSISPTAVRTMLTFASMRRVLIFLSEKHGSGSLSHLAQGSSPDLTG
jgi:hypothetical protein